MKELTIIVVQQLFNSDYRFDMTVTYLNKKAQLTQRERATAVHV